MEIVSSNIRSTALSGRSDVPLMWSPTASAMFTAWSAIRSRSFVIPITMRMVRRSRAMGWCRAMSDVHSASRSISVWLARGSSVSMICRGRSGWRDTSAERLFSIICWTNCP